MSFWQNLEIAAGMSRGFYWLALGFALTASALFALLPAERTRVRNALLLFALAVAGLLAAATLLSFGTPENGSAYRWTRWAALMILGVAVINLAGVLLFDVALSAVRLKSPRIMRDLLSALAYIVFAITLLSRSGVDLTGIVATSAVITAIIGFSLADTLGNIMGGMALQMERVISVGDWVRVDKIEGQVKEISWRQTSIETRDWDTVVIPNSVLMKGQVALLGHKLAAPRQRRQWVYFNVDFRHSPTEVMGAVDAALCAEPIANVAAAPAPHCLLIDFKDSYATYAARYWLTDMALPDPTDSVVRARIYFALRRAGVPLSIPAQKRYVVKDSETRREREREQEVERRVEALRHIELFRALTEDEQYWLAARLRVAPFVHGEAITRQGAEAHWLYILTKGEAEVRVTVDGESQKVATLRDGDFFGEMGMMTGEPRASSVVALTDVECYRLDKEGFNDILHRRPEVAEDISHILARRRAELDAIREGLSEEAMRQRMQGAQGALLARIRKFFKLADQ
jgi:small-conductance mechanosensitive channel/CRP-like cAMP-binding protein